MDGDWTGVRRSKWGRTTSRLDPPTPWNASPRDVYGTPGPYEDAAENTPIFEENGPDNFEGVDIMRAVRSFDPCLPCGVHMYTGKGRVRKVVHTPTGLS